MMSHVEMHGVDLQKATPNVPFVHIQSHPPILVHSVHLLAFTPAFCISAKHLSAASGSFRWPYLGFAGLHIGSNLASTSDPPQHLIYTDL